jgi:branched-chain amino acid transport system ATP-binding protein
VLLIDHRMEVVMDLADRVTVLNFGETIADGSPDEVRADPLVVAAYLGKRQTSDLKVRVADEPSLAREHAPTRDPILTVRGLEVHYGGIRALRGVDFEVFEGEVVALIGANGAGKSTSLKTVSGMPELFKSVRGEVTYRGERIERLPAHRIARMGIAHVPEGRRVFPESTVEGNLLLGGYARRESEVRRDFDMIYDRFPSLGRRRDRLAGLLSGGEQQMLAIARALASRPTFLLLDEPSLGLAPITAHQVFRIVRDLADDGVTVLVVEQAATSALSIADRAYVLEIGAVVATGSAASLIDDPEVKAAYLRD